MHTRLVQNYIEWLLNVLLKTQIFKTILILFRNRVVTLKILRSWWMSWFWYDWAFVCLVRRHFYTYAWIFSDGDHLLIRRGLITGWFLLLTGSQNVWLARFWFTEKSLWLVENDLLKSSEILFTCCADLMVRVDFSRKLEVTSAITWRGHIKVKVVVWWLVKGFLHWEQLTRCLHQRILGDCIYCGSFDMVLPKLVYLSTVFNLICLIKLELIFWILIGRLLQAELTKCWVRCLDRTLTVKILWVSYGYFELFVNIASEFFPKLLVNASHFTLEIFLSDPATLKQLLH